MLFRSHSGSLLHELTAGRDRSLGGKHARSQVGFLSFSWSGFGKRLYLIGWIVMKLLSLSRSKVYRGCLTKESISQRLFTILHEYVKFCKVAYFFRGYGRFAARVEYLSDRDDGNRQDNGRRNSGTKAKLSVF